MRIGLDSLIDPKLEPYIDEARQFNEAAEANAVDTEPPDPTTSDGLRLSREGLPPRPPAPGPPATEEVVESGGRQATIRILMPQDIAPRGVHLDIHGGGFYLGSAKRGDIRNRQLADAVEIAVVSVEYRLAPEHPYPAAPDDCETAALWLIERAQERFGTERLTIGGPSAGASLAVTTLLRLRDKQLAHAFSGAVLKFGSYDLSGQTPGGRVLAGEDFITLYAGHVADLTHPDISPIFGDLRGLPPTLLVVGTLDLVIEESLAMAARLAAAENDVDLRVYPESPHNFTAFPTAMAAAAHADVESWMAERLAVLR